jgi:hypothetical protein
MGAKMIKAIYNNVYKFFESVNNMAKAVKVFNRAFPKRKIKKVVTGYVSENTLKKHLKYWDCHLMPLFFKTKTEFHKYKCEIVIYELPKTGGKND